MWVLLHAVIGLNVEVVKQLMAVPAVHRALFGGTSATKVPEVKKKVSWSAATGGVVGKDANQQLVPPDATGTPTTTVGESDANANANQLIITSEDHDDADAAIILRSFRYAGVRLNQLNGGGLNTK